MTTNLIWEQTLFAVLGGIAAELLHWYALSRRPGAIAKYKTLPLYWWTTIGMVAFGALMPLLYLDGSAPALLCFHLGATAPVILQKLVANLPSATVTQGNEVSMRDFFRW